MRSFIDLANLDFSVAKGSTTIITGLSIKQAFDGVINGKQVLSGAKYYVDFMTDGIVGTYGFVSETIILDEDSFNKFFGGTHTFTEDWLFTAVLMGVQEDKTREGKKNNKLLTYVMKDPRVVPLVPAKGGSK